MARFLALEWDAREARIAVARTRGNEIAVEHAFSVDLQSRDGEARGEADVGPRIAAALAARGLGRVETLVAVGRANIELRQLTLPPSPPEELPELVRFQALRQFTTINESWPIDFVPVDAGESESLHVIAAAISPELVTQIQASCEAADLSAKRVILRPFAAASLLRRCEPPGHSPCTLMVDLLAEEADLTVMVNNQVAMMRTVRLSTGHGTEAQSRAMLGEIRRTIAAAQNQLRGHRVERVVMCGDGSVQAALKTLIEENLSHRVEWFDPFGQLPLEGDLAQSKPEHPGRFAPLLGMLADEAGGAAHAIDFLHPREAPAPPNPWKSNAVYIGAGVAVCLGLILLLVANMASLDREIAVLEAESRALDKTVEKAKKKLDDVNRVEDFLRTDYVWLDEIKNLADTLPPADDVIFTQVNLIAATTGGQISLDGYTRKSSHIEDVQRALRSSGRRILSKGGQIDNRRDEYKWQFKEVMVLGPKEELTIVGPRNTELESTEDAAEDHAAADAEAATDGSPEAEEMPVDVEPVEQVDGGEDTTAAQTVDPSDGNDPATEAVAAELSSATAASSPDIEPQTAPAPSATP